MKKIGNFRSYKLMLQYISKIFFKSVSTYVCFFLFCIMILIISLAPVFLKNLQSPEILDYIFYIEISIVCIGIGVQTIIKTSQIFLDSQADGDDIILITKSTNRIEIWLARFSFILFFGLIVSLINTFLMNIGSFLIANILTTNNLLLLTVGAFGAQFITFLVVSSTVVLLGLFFGPKIGRSIPAAFFACSYVIANFTNITSNYITSAPINQINATFNDEINKNINVVKNKLQEYDPNNTNIQYITGLSSNNQSFLGSINNRLVFEQLTFTTNNNGVEGSIDISINSTNVNYIFQWLSSSLKNKNINANNFLLAIDYINPLSGILKIARTNIEKNLDYNSIQELSSYSNYYNIAPMFSNGKYFQEDKTNPNNIIYYTTFVEERLDEPWMLAISWSSVAILIFSLSSLMYYRREIK